MTEYPFSSTPLEKMYKDDQIQNSCCQIIHHSDTLRLAILYRCEEISPTITVSAERKKFNKAKLLCWSLISNKYSLDLIRRYGGQYSDLDTVSLLKTNYLENIVSVSGDFISNANMIFAPHHPFVLALMRAANKKFTGRGWNSLGQCLVIFQFI